MSDIDFSAFCKDVDPQNRVAASGESISFWNSNDQEFVIRYKDALAVLRRFLDQNEAIEKFIQNHWDYKANEGVWAYREKVFRELFVTFFKEAEYSSAVANARSQTKGYISTLSKLVGWTINNRACSPPNRLLFDKSSLQKFFENPKPLTSAAGTPSLGVRTLADAFRIVCSLCAEYDQSSDAWIQTDLKALATVTALAQIADWAKEKFSNFAGIKIDVEYSKGVGKFPRVPWVCLLPSGQTVGNGVYVAICFGREGAGAVAGFAESVKNPKGLKTIDRNKQKPLQIDLTGGGESTSYNAAFENPQEFRPEDFNEEKFRIQIATSLSRCLEFLGMKPKEKFGFQQMAAFQSALAAIGFNVINTLPANFIVALHAKPFLILTGNSGTGKTKLAELFASWLCGNKEHRSALVPVGADWTDNRNVLGFVNHIRPTKPEGEQDEVPVYQSTKILDLLLAAREDSTRPYFLILDEMNLSHIERYFADFLSAMESKDGGLHLHREGRNLPRKPKGKADVPETLPLPQNVFVIGTVNVDETTYMFSPKVLDRANVIEFRVDAGAPKSFLASGGKSIGEITPAPDGYDQAFLELSYRARGLNEGQPLVLVPNPPPEAKEALAKCTDTIDNLFALMQKCHQEFAFRSMAEILRFLAVDYELTADKAKWNWQAAMDAQILQKILPKLHGSKRKIGPLLVALATYCEEGKKDAAEKLLMGNAGTEMYEASGEKVFKSPVFPDSHRKLCEMILGVRRDQFVSFIQ